MYGQFFYGKKRNGQNARKSDEEKWKSMLSTFLCVRKTWGKKRLALRSALWRNSATGVVAALSDALAVCVEVEFRLQGGRMSQSQQQTNHWASGAAKGIVPLDAQKNISPRGIKASAISPTHQTTHQPAQKTGLRTLSPERTVDPSRLKHGPTRDEAITRELEAMNRKDEKPYPLKYVSNAPAHQAGIRKVGARSGQPTDIFGPPVEQQLPARRLRPELGEEQLAKIHHSDSSKTQQQEAMASNKGMIERMSEQQKPGKAGGIRTTAGTHEAKASDDAVQGFRGLGSNDRKPPAKGRSCKPVEPFVPEVPEPKKAQRFKDVPPKTKAIGYGV